MGPPKKKDKNNNNKMALSGIGATISIDREIHCLLYAGFFKDLEPYNTIVLEQPSLFYNAVVFCCRYNHSLFPIVLYTRAN